MQLCEAMNQYLANQMVMYIKLHNLHWYIQGQAFFTLHGKFEELYGQTAEIIDEVAERLMAKGKLPVGSLKKALSMSKVKELEDQPIDAEEAMHQLVTDVEYWVKDTGELIALAEGAGDRITADLFTGYLKEYEKLHWMLGAYNK